MTRLARSSIRSRNVYIPGRPPAEAGLTDVMTLASNENPLGASPAAVAAMIEEVRQRSHLYPDSQCDDLRAALAARLGRDADWIIVDNGADGVITLIGLTFIDPGDRVVFSDVSFPAYENIAGKMGGVAVRVPLRGDMRIDIDGFIGALVPSPKLVFLCNPNNPTGTIVEAVEFARLLEAIPDETLLVVDEAYVDFVVDSAYPASLELLDRHRNMIVLRTFSKISGLAGLRIGYAIADPALVDVMLKAREPYSVNRVAQAGAVAALADDEFSSRTREHTRSGLEYYYRALEGMGLGYTRSHANFLLVDVGRDAAPVAVDLLERGIMVRPLGHPDLRTHLRITVGSEEQNRAVVAALGEILTGGEERDR